MAQQDLQKIAHVLRGQNPWWGANLSTGSPLLRLPPKPRFAFHRLLKTAEGRSRLRGMLLYGPRRTGKTTLIRHCGWDVITRQGLDPTSVLFADFEHPYLWDADLDALMEAHRLLHPDRVTKLLLLDEIQRLPKWDSWLKVLADHSPDTPFIATGSAAIPLLKGSFESGPGRWEELELPPLLFSEYLAMVEPRIDEISFSPISLRSVAPGGAIPQQTDLASAGPSLGQHFRAYLARGGFPEAAKQQTVDAAQRVMREEVVARAVGRDIARDLGSGRVDDVERVFTYLAETTGQLINETTVSGTLGVQRATLSNYIGHLERAGLCWRAGRKAGSKGSMKAQRKGYISDASLAAAALWEGAAVLDDFDRLGNLAETAAGANIRALARHEGGRVHYWRDKRGREVDFLVELPGAPLIGIEIKYRSSFKKNFVDGLVAFAKARPKAKTILLVPASVAAKAPSVPDGIIVWAMELFVAGLGLQVALDQERDYREEVA